MISKINSKLDDVGRSRYLSPRAFDLTCVLIGVLGTLLGLTAISAPVFLPPIPPSWEAEQVVQYFRDHHQGVLAAAIASVLCGTCYSISAAIFSSYLQRIPNLPKTIAYVQLGAGNCIAVVFILGGTTLAAATYRLDRPPEIILALSDLFWLTYMMPMPSLQVQCLCIAWASLADTRPKPAFPRWLGIFNLLYVIASTPVFVCHTVYDGPLAWDGALTFWFTLGGWGLACVFEYTIMFRSFWSAPEAELTETASEETRHIS